MQTIEIKLFINNVEQTLQAQEDKVPGNFVITQNLKFIARIFKDVDGRWKSVEISDLSPSVIDSIGTEIEATGITGNS
ncbi:hypothetical protein [Desertivirga arenae]|uniref:hypothetical protein n=1 Tax=Desertivirga arenae TaxID=2810309 RepID=UPI001A95DB9B|nr:hypothetical protein [Pedobacter sp. SYSU D00823]